MYQNVQQVVFHIITKMFIELFEYLPRKIFYVLNVYYHVFKKNHNPKKQPQIENYEKLFEIISN